jgi:hypothetical protein
MRYNSGNCLIITTNWAWINAHETQTSFFSWWWRVAVINKHHVDSSFSRLWTLGKGEKQSDFVSKEESFRPGYRVT